MNIIFSMKQTVEYWLQEIARINVTTQDHLILAHCGKEPLGIGIRLLVIQI